MAPSLAPSGPLPLDVIKESAVQVTMRLSSVNPIGFGSFLPKKPFPPPNFSLKAKLMEGDFGAKCAAGKYAAALLNEMGKQVRL